MKPASCARLFEAEAMRDGRLAGAARASFERHIASCAACAREVEALASLADALRAAPSSPPDELRVRRERTRLLAAFDRELISPERPPSARRRLIFSVVLAAAAVSMLALWGSHRAAEPVRIANASSAVVRAGNAAEWSQRTEGDREAIVLERGELWIRVDHARGTRRVIVLLPDGELEDTGTTFTVSAEAGRTARVAVEEGSVVLRVRGRPPVAIDAGGVWTPTAQPEHSAPVVVASGGVPPAPSLRDSHSPRVPAPSASGVANDASADFRAAMSALDRGDNRQAAVAFASFVVKHPRDARAEDAAYLRVIALERCGDRDGAKAAAHEYLRSYPVGFRRTEVELLAR